MTSDLLPSALSLLAQLTPTTGPAVADAPWWAKLISSPMFPLVIGLIILYFFVYRQKKTQDNQRQNLLDSVKKGDLIETIGGLYGTVISVDEKQVLLKVDETANVKMRFNRRAVHRVVVEEEKK